MRPLLAEHSKVVQEEEGGLGLSTTTLPTDDDALVPRLLEHGVVGSISNGEDVRGQLAQSVVLVELHILGIVYGVVLEGVDRDEDGAHVRVDVAPLEPRPQVLQQGLFCEVWQLA